MKAFKSCSITHRQTHIQTDATKRVTTSVFSSSSVASYGALGHVPPSTSNNFIFSSLRSKSDSELSKYCVVCEISWCRCQQLTALSISTALVTKLLVIKQLLHPVLKFAVSAPCMHDPISSFAPPRDKSWRRRCSRVVKIRTLHAVTLGLRHFNFTQSLLTSQAL